MAIPPSSRLCLSFSPLPRAGRCNWLIGNRQQATAPFTSAATSRRPAKQRHKWRATLLLPMGRRDAAAALAVVLAAAAAAAVSSASSSPAEGFQPLSKIAVHRTTVEMQPSAYVRATPSLLGGQVRARSARSPPPALASRLSVFLLHSSTYLSLTSFVVQTFPSSSLQRSK